MKVTVCFGDVRVIVPCGSGDLLVGDLIEKAILRYKKATGKPPDYWVAVHNLKSVSDGGILDADDQLNDVADDREQIIALYEEQDGPPAHHNGGDGTSASSVGTSSPDIFQGGDLSGALNNNTKGFSPIMRYEGKNDVVITPNDLTSGSSLIVRRGSEPTLNTVGTSVPSLNVVHIGDGNLKASKRWSAIAAIDEVRSKDSGNSDDDEKPLPPHRMEGNGEEKSAFSRFARDSARQSLASNSSAMYKWLEAQERQENHYNEMRDGRKEPLGGTDASDDENVPRSAFLPPQKKEGELIVFRNTRSGPLGIHVVPNYADDGRDMGLVIQGIEAGGRTYQDGRLHVQDRIVEINGTSLMDVDFQKAQEIFKQSIFSDEVRLRVIKSDLAPVMKQPPPVLPKPSIKKKPDNLDLSKLNTKGQNGLGSPQQQSSPARVQSPVSPTQTNGQVSPSSPGKKVPPAVPARHPNTSLSTAKGRLPALTNTRKIGKKLLIQLTKGPDGLGFSITTRDNPAGGNCPIYIKNILPKGAAVRDGKLKSGDRLLEVNGIEMTGKTQADAVSILRNTKLGSVVNLQVSRQVLASEADTFAVPRELRQNNSPKARPASTIGFLRPTPDVISTVPSSRSNENLLEEDTAPKPPDWLMKWDEKREEDLSPTDSEPSVPFQREGFGRQSMSEKRRTQLDPRNTEIYQKVKMNKEGGQDENHSDHGKPADHGSGEDSSETHGLTDLPSPGLLKRVGSAESLVSQTNRSSVHENKDLGPMLGLKKSSSLESLQAAVQEVSLEDEGNYFKAPNRGMVRGRGCNDSFRAAVDRSYEAPMETEPMETLEEEGSESGSGGQGRGSVSTHSSFSSNEPQVQEVDVSKKQRKKKEKGGGIFKGLGHMFRFGRHRKAMEERAPKQTAAELHKQREQELLKQRQEEIEKYKARHHQEQERERIKEHYLKLQDGQRMPEPQRPHPPEDVYPPVDNYESRSGSPSTPQTRAERIQQLRAEHQRRHRERQGQYPLDAQEEQYEQQMRLYERQYKGEELVHPAYVLPPRRRSEDPYDSHCPYIFRPVSRLGHVDPNHYSHYQNYDEIRAQLQRHDHLQQAYHQHHLQQQMGRQPSANSVPDPRSYAGYDPRVHMQSDNRVYPMHEQDSRGYLHARPPQEHWDSRGWLHGQPARTKTPSDWSSGSHSPPRARSNTPINQMGYLSHHNSKPPLGTMMVTHDNYRDYMDYDDPRHAYSEQTSYGSLPRANRLKNTVISGSAQV